MGNETTVLIVDHCPVFRMGLATILQADTGIKVVGEVRDGPEAVSRALEIKPDVLIGDGFLSGCSGLEVLSRIRERLPNVITIILADSEREGDILAALQSGVNGYLLKSCSNAELVEAVRRCIKGEVILHSAITTALVTSLRKKATEPKLSARESEILRLIGDGLNNREIARCLFVTESTVRTHIYRMLEKLHLNSRRDITLYAARIHPVSSRIS